MRYEPNHFTMDFSLAYNNCLGDIRYMGNNSRGVFRLRFVLRCLDDCSSREVMIASILITVVLLLVIATIVFLIITEI